MRTARKTMFAFAVMSLMVFVARTVRADWYEGDPAKWVQLPDLDSLTSLDVYTVHPKLLADDFECTSTAPITSIHIWGSWKGDNLPGVWEDDPAGGPPVFIPDPSLVNLRLAIHADIPADQSGLGYSIPGEMLWEDYFDPSYGNFTVRFYEWAPQGWYNPDAAEYYLGDHTGVWQYNFYPEEPFEQLGAPPGEHGEPVVYWLGVCALVEGQQLDPDVDPEFGWKISLDHWNDDAVYASAGGHGAEGGDWQEVRYPDGHEYQGESIDLAFVIVPEPVTMVVLALGLLPPVLLRKRKRRQT